MGLVRLRKCCLIAILNVVGFGVNFCSVSSFQALGRVKYGSFFIWSVLAKGILRSSAFRRPLASFLIELVIQELCRDEGQYLW